ncbi:hypothetical protein H2248_001779 [Termitomyces sp. 'cryptogamus']|nr:hypothetical protein H2248_001779 [Termitomyces sp. 'cryptogamus']
MPRDLVTARDRQRMGDGKIETSLVSSSRCGQYQTCVPEWRPLSRFRPDMKKILGQSKKASSYYGTHAIEEELSKDIEAVICKCVSAILFACKSHHVSAK